MDDESDYNGPIFIDDDYIQLCYDYTDDPSFSTDSCIEESCFNIYFNRNYCSTG